jgi:hypothetical protein
MEILSYFLFYLGVNTLLAVAALFVREIAKRAQNA